MPAADCIVHSSRKLSYLRPPVIARVARVHDACRPAEIKDWTRDCGGRSRPCALRPVAGSPDWACLARRPCSRFLSSSGGPGLAQSSLHRGRAPFARTAASRHSRLPTRRVQWAASTKPSVLSHSCIACSRSWVGKQASKLASLCQASPSLRTQGHACPRVDKSSAFPVAFSLRRWRGLCSGEKQQAPRTDKVRPLRVCVPCTPAFSSTTPPCTKPRWGALDAHHVPKEVPG